ncbi:MAG TPA: hypothetical protein VF306_10015 [Pirellulales bacterium]
MNDELATLRDAWIAYQHSGHSAPLDDATFHALDRIYDLTREEPDSCWELILEILAADDSVAVQETLSAGPLEDLLVEHGDAIIARVEQESARNPHFRSLLGGVWKNAMSDKIWSRVCAVRDLSGWDTEEWEERNNFGHE